MTSPTRRKPPAASFANYFIKGRSLLKRARQVALWLALITSVTGCTGMELAALPNTSPRHDNSSGTASVLRVGDNVRIGLTTGERIRGEVAAVTAESVTIISVGNYGRREDVVAAADIQTVERVTSGNVWTVVALVGAGVIVLLAKSFAEWELN